MKILAHHLFWLLCLLPCLTLTAEPCTNYQQLNQSIGQTIKSIERSQNLATKHQHQLELIRLSADAATALARCTQNIIGATPDTLIRNWYTIGKLYWDGNKHDLAVQYFRKCVNDPTADFVFRGTFSIKELAQAYLSNPFNHQDPTWPTNPSEHQGIAHHGKGGSFIQNLLKQIENTDVFLDDRPYLSHEIEELSLRRQQITKENRDSIHQYFAQFSPDKTVVIRPPYVLIGGPGVYAHTVAQNENEVNRLTKLFQRSADGPSNTFYHSTTKERRLYLEEVLYKKVIAPYQKYFRVSYFNKNKPKHLIPIYVVGSDETELHANDQQQFMKSLKQYGNYRSQIHYRNNVDLAYYLPYDNSIMVWILTGTGSLNHELVHALMEADAPDTPEWLAEGMASLYEVAKYMRVKEGKKRVLVEPGNNYRWYYLEELRLRKGCLPSLSLFLNQTQTKTSNDDFALVKAAFARYFSLFLHENEVLAEVYQQIRDKQLANKSSEQMALIQELLKEPTWASVEQRWTAFLQQITEPMAWSDMRPQIKKHIHQLPILPWTCPNEDILIRDKQQITDEQTGTWQWSLSIEAPEKTLQQIDCVEYTISKTIKNKITIPNSSKSLDVSQSLLTKEYDNINHSLSTYKIDCIQTAQKKICVTDTTLHQNLPFLFEYNVTDAHRWEANVIVWFKDGIRREYVKFFGKTKDK